jgi:hypothetical protein
MRIILVLGVLGLAWSGSTTAGCIGTVIMGECHGSQVPWDTHPPGQSDMGGIGGGMRSLGGDWSSAGRTRNQGYVVPAPALAPMPQQAPPGFYWDKRGTEFQRQHPEYVNPFTGRDAHDSNWFLDLTE